MKDLSKVWNTYFNFIGKIIIHFLLFSSFYRIIVTTIHNELDLSHDFFEMLYLGFMFDFKLFSHGIAVLFLLITILVFFGKINKHISQFVRLFYTFILSIILLIYLMDIPYFNFYNSRINNGIFTWFDSLGATFSSIAFDWRYILITIIWISSTIFIYKYTKRIIPQRATIKKQWFSRTAAFIIYLAIFFTGMRGTLDFGHMPLETEDAYFSSSTNKNQLSINPVYNLITSMKNFELNLYNSDFDAYNDFIKNHQINTTYGVKREVLKAQDSIYYKKNIVLIIVESLSSHKVGYYGFNKQNLTPFLDSLALNCQFYPNLYTDGIHTHNGLFSLLYSYSNILNEKAFASSKSAGFKYGGLAYELSENGYTNSFLCSGNTKFDNMESFLLFNHFDTILGKKTFPKEICRNSWGVSDESLFKKAGNYNDRMELKGKPFFTTILTLSSHEGNNPLKCDTYKERADLNKKDQIYAYTDWCISKFINENKHKKWFKESIFIITSDHGQNFNAIYDMPLAYHHSPLYLFAGDNSIKKEINEQFILQQDVFPLIMHHLNFPYTNNSMGFNPKTHKRPYAFFTSDDEIGCISEEWLMIERTNSKPKLYKYKLKDRKDYSALFPEIVDKMRKYAYMNLQTNNYLMLSRQISL